MTWRENIERVLAGPGRLSSGQRAALTALTAQIEELERERDEREAGAQWQYEMGKGWKERAEAAEQRVKELERAVKGKAAVIEIAGEELQAAEQRVRELEAALRPFVSGDWTLPERGVGTAWATMHCPFCDFMGPADKWVATLEANHDPDCPILVARHALAQSDPPEDSE